MGRVENWLLKKTLAHYPVRLCRRLTPPTEAAESRCLAARFRNKDLSCREGALALDGRYDSGRPAPDRHPPGGAATKLFITSCWAVCMATDFRRQQFGTFPEDLPDSAGG
jgi:hypothetical protein